LNTYLIGFMGSGKSALGKQLANLLHSNFVDMDELFEQRYHLSIYDFFGKYGEDNFRKIERELLLETINLENTVISTGGGTPCFYDNMSFIRDNGISVYLRMTSGELTQRLKTVKKKRPLIKEMPAESLEEWISVQLTYRETYYLQANFIFYPLTEDIRDLALRLG